MGMFKVAVDVGVELARHLENPEGAVKDNYDSQVLGGRIGGGLLGGALGAVPGMMAGSGVGTGLGVGLGALLGGVGGGELGKYLHKRELERILRHPETSREDAQGPIGWRGALMTAMLGGQGALMGADLGGASGALLGGGVGAAMGLGHSMADQHHRRALIEELVGRKGQEG